MAVSLWLLAPGVIKAQSVSSPTIEMEPFLDLSFTQAERDSLFKNLKEYQAQVVALHGYPIPNQLGMSLLFNPFPRGFTPETRQNPIDWALPSNVQIPSNPADIAFLPVHKLAALIKARKISSMQLTRLCLDRLKKYSNSLQCTITLLEETALVSAKRADDELAKGKYRGPLHGIPFGIKDLLAVHGTKTTWGAAPYKDQVIAETATVVRKLQDAGAVLVVKLSLGALAYGDIWYDGVTKNPWDLKQGSSGSSAGSAAATAAGLVPFALGTETLGSIVSPSTRCGTTGLRPSYGRVSRQGAMALSWSMDKIGPICRSALDCAMVLNAIRGSDGIDPSVHDAPFNYSRSADVRKLRVAYFQKAFEENYPTRDNDLKALDVLRSLGVELKPIDLTPSIPVSSLRLMLNAEAAAAFDELTRSNRDSLMTDQRRSAWPNIFRASRFISAVDYINASRLRAQLINEFFEKTKGFDVIVAPSFGGGQLLLTNLTGTPCLVLPNGFNKQGTPTSISFLGRLDGEAALVILGQAYQDATGWDEQVPPLFK